MSTIDLPETQVFPGTPENWTFARARQLEGTLNDDPMLGVWPITHQRLSRGWGRLAVARNMGEPIAWPPPDPSRADEAAKPHRRNLYYRVWSSLDARKAFARGHAVSASFRVTEKWRTPPEGKLDFDQTDDRVLGGHCLGIMPPLYMTPCPHDWCDDEFFVGLNSWGLDWGNRGFFAMRPQFFDREVYEAWATDHRTAFPNLNGNGIQHIQWKPGEDLDNCHLAYDIVDADADNRLAWAIVVLRRGEMHVDDLFVKPEARGRGYGATMVRAFAEESRKLRLPLRFWIPFADVEHRESVERLQHFFAKQGFGFEKSLFRSAACCAVPGGEAELPLIAMPPKASFVFATSDRPKVDWHAVQRTYQVSDDFLQHARSVFERHGEALRRLA